MPDEAVEMDGNMQQTIDTLRAKFGLLPTEDVIQTLLAAAIEQERKPQEPQQ